MVIVPSKLGASPPIVLRLTQKQADATRSATMPCCRASSVTICISDGRRFQIHLTHDHKLSWLRAQVADLTGLPPHDQLLFLGSRQLSGDPFLCECGLQDTSCIFVVASGASASSLWPQIDKRLMWHNKKGSRSAGRASSAPRTVPTAWTSKCKASAVWMTQQAVDSALEQSTALPEVSGIAQETTYMDEQDSNNVPDELHESPLPHSPQNLLHVAFCRADTSTAAGSCTVGTWKPTLRSSCSARALRLDKGGPCEQARGNRKPPRTPVSKVARTQSAHLSRANTPCAAAC